jgi:aspartyl-tRNA(Asn)/glutamyl-tRNA(Gln) amidotransferase subunit C
VVSTACVSTTSKQERFLGVGLDTVGKSTRPIRPTESFMKTELQVDEKLVKEIASLARLDLSQEETEMFVSQFKDILDYVSILNEVDTENVPPAYLSSANKTVVREDVIEESIPTSEFIANAPQSKDSYIVIPRVHTEQ